MKLQDLVSGENDIRKKYFSVDIDGETKDDLSDELDINADDIDYILRHASIYVDGDSLDKEIKVGK